MTYLRDVGYSDYYDQTAGFKLTHTKQRGANNFFCRNDVVSPDSCYPHSVFQNREEMLPSADISYASAYFLQKSTQHAAQSACAVDEVVGILATVHRERLTLVLYEIFEKQYPKFKK